MKTRLFSMLGVVCFFVLSVQAQTLTPTVDQVIYNLMGPVYRDGSAGYGTPWGAHEAVPNGVPSNYDWAPGARPGTWLDNAAYQGINIWGQAYVESGGSPVTNYRVQVRNMVSYKYENAQWTMIEQTPNNIGGGWYKEDFGTSNIVDGNKRSESSNGGGISATMVSGETFHFWTDSWPRAQMPHSAQAIYAVCEARIIADTDPNVNLSNVKLMVGLGMDAYTTRDYSAGSEERITSVAIGRMQKITNQWKPICIYVTGTTTQSYTDYQNNVKGRPLPPGVQAGTSTGGGTYKIMPLGDSKTEGGGGSGHHSWRGYLRAKLMQDGYTIDYVGPKSNTANGDGTPNDNNHAGHGGYTIGPDNQTFCTGCETTGLFEHVIDWMNAANPDVVLLAVGVNDFFNAANHPANYTSTAPQRYQDLVNRIMQTKPNVKLVVGTIEPVKWDQNWGGNPSDNDLGALNAKIKAIADASTTDNIFFADIRTKMLVGWGAGDYYDDIHLSQQGATKDANAWYDAVKPILTGGSSTVAVTGVSVSPTTASVAVGATTSITATVAPSNATNKNVSWSSSNTSIATVNAGGVVTGVVTGSATITITTQDGNKTATCSVTVTSSGSTSNLALNKTTTVSSSESATYAGSYAVDDNSSTRWASASSDPQWIYVDLGASYSISRVKLLWETAYGKSYKIQTSTDASSWTDIFSTTTGDGGTDDLTGLSGTGRYIRMYGTIRGTTWGYSLYEFEVYGSSAGGSANGNGTVVLEKWTGVSGTAISNNNFTLAPNSTSNITSLEAPSNAADNYAARIRGYLIPSTSGSYYLYIASDDNGELWFSTNDQPSTKSRVAYVSSWTNSREWIKETNQKSAAISLTAGTKYYFEALMKEGSGGDNLAIGWTGPGVSTVTIPSGVNIDTYNAGSSTIAVTGVTMSPTTANIAVNATTQLTATVAPSNATNKTVSWSSSNTAIATVSTSGLVTGKATGTATITVTTQDGNKTATCTVTVTSDAVTNLLATNSSFESETGVSYTNGAWTGITGWDAFNNAYDHIAVGSGSAYDGNNKLELCKAGWAETKAANRASVTAGSVYNASFALSKTVIYSTSAPSPVIVEIKWYNSAGTLISASSSGNLLNGTVTTAWAVFNFDATAPANAVKAGVRVTLVAGAYPNDNLAQISADKFRLTAGAGLKSAYLESYNVGNKAQLNQENLSVYPNPLRGNSFKLKVEGFAGNANLKIFNTLGVVVYTDNFEFNNELELPATVLKGKGMYLVSLNSMDKLYNAKLIVK